MRKIFEEREKEWLSDYAKCAVDSLGRRVDEPQCPNRTVFQRDRDRILHSKAFRRLKDKTQVFLSPEGDHYRTRMTHVLEVSQISRAIARSLRLNEDLTEAIALGHDLGHTPFGHSGEKVLNKIHEGGFHHRRQSLRVVDVLAIRKNGLHGLNLTEEVRDGILNHSGPNTPMTLEGQIVKLSDRIAYINHDIDDAIRAEVLKLEDIPKDFVDYFGKYTSDRINKMILNVTTESTLSDTIKMSDEAWQLFDAMRQFMFKNVYLDDRAKGEEQKAMNVVDYLYKYYKASPDKMPQEFLNIYHNEGDVGVKDYIAGMTDRYAISCFVDLTVPAYWSKR